MPHTNSRTSTATKRKQAKPVHTKRVVLEDGEGWTHVVGGKTRKYTSNEILKTEKGDFSIGKFEYMSKTIEELHKEYESSKRNWERSSAHGELKKLLKRQELPKIDKIVVFGLGTFQAVEAQHSRTSMTQLAALNTIMEMLGGQLPVVQQDPAYTPLDKAFLETFKHTVSDDPEGYQSVSSTSLVYAIHCYPDVYENIRAAQIPAMLIGNNLKGEEPTAFNNLEEFKDLQKLYEGLEVSFAMPQFGNSFSSTVLFSHKREEAAVQEVAKAIEAEQVAQLIEGLKI